MQEAIDELVEHYFQDTIYEMESVPFGLTNLTKIITIAGKKYVIRIYHPHIKHVEGIELEIGITSYLSKRELFFQVPVFLRTLNGDETYLSFYREMISLLEMNTHQLMELPKQLVHHDLLIFNLLAQDNQIRGVLDFDFTTLCYRIY